MKKQLSSLVQGIFGGGFAGVALTKVGINFSYLAIAGVSVLGGVGKPFVDKWWWGTDLKTSKKTIPYTMVGVALGLTATKFFEYRLYNWIN